MPTSVAISPDFNHVSFWSNEFQFAVSAAVIALLFIFQYVSVAYLKLWRCFKKKYRVLAGVIALLSHTIVQKSRIKTSFWSEEKCYFSSVVFDAYLDYFAIFGRFWLWGWYPPLILIAYDSRRGWRWFVVNLWCFTQRITLISRYFSSVLSYFATRRFPRLRGTISALAAHS